MTRIWFIRQLLFIRCDLTHVLNFGQLISTTEIVCYFCKKRGTLSVVEYFTFIQLQLKKGCHVV